MITGIHILQKNICSRYADCFKILFRTWSQACFAIVTAFLDGNPSWISCRLYILCHLDISVESIGHFICRQDQSNEEPLFIWNQFGSQFGVFYLLGYIKPMQRVNLNVFFMLPSKCSAITEQQKGKLQIRILHALSFLVVDCGHIDLGFIVHLKRFLHI